jgi:DNA-damage-inducible protein J
MASTNLNIRVDEDLKKKADALFNDLGLSMSSAITVFLRSCVDYNGIPFEIRRPNRISTGDDELLSASRAIIDQNRKAYEEISK